MAVGNSTPFLGYESYIGVCEESTYSDYATATSFAEFTTESLMKEREEIRLEEINTTRDYTRRMTGNETVSGSIEALLNIAEDFHVKCMKQAMGGTVGSTTLTASAFTHVLNVGDMESNDSTSGTFDAKALSFTVRRGDTEQFAYRGMRVNTLTIKGEVGSPIAVTYELMGRYGTSSSYTVTPSFNNNINPLNFTGVTFNTGATISSVSIEYITGFEFTLANNLAEQRVLGSANIYTLPPLRRDVTLSLNQQFDTTTAYDRFIQNTKTAIQILMDTGITIAAAGSSTYSMAINLPCCFFNSNTPQAGSMETINQEIAVSAIKDTTTSYVCQLVVNNATTSY